MLNGLPSAQPELIEQSAYVRGFEQGRTQGMIDAQGGKEMNKQRKVVITITYNEMGIIVDTKAEELGSSAQPEQRWIPCSERLPIGSDVVLLSLPPSIDANGDELVEGVICGHYIGGKNELWGISDGSTFGYGLVSTRYGTNPTHWMPLPEPYREEK